MDFFQRCTQKTEQEGKFNDFRCGLRAWKDGLCRRHHPDGEAERKAERELEEQRSKEWDESAEGKRCKEKWALERRDKLVGEHLRNTNLEFYESLLYQKMLEN